MKRLLLNITFFAHVALALLAPFPSFATLIAAVMSSDQPRYRDAHRAFVKSMEMRGYGTPSTEIILQSPNPDPLSWSNVIRKFNAYRPDLIVAYGAPAALVALRESGGIPVVSADVFAAEQPMKGMCGVSSRVPMVTILKTLKDIGQHQKVGVLYSSREAGSLRQLEDIQKFSGQLGMTVLEANITSAALLDKALNNMLDKVEVVVVTEGAFVSSQFDRIVSRARTRKIPIVSTMPDAAEKGAMLSLEINPQEQGNLLAEMASRVLEGAKAEHFSLLSPRRIDLVINMKVAREMGIKLPFTVLGTATRLIK